jgi:hypothetical protein
MRTIDPKHIATLAEFVLLAIYRQESFKFGANLEYIINFVGLRILSIYVVFFALNIDHSM